jgi:hypothetical protein
MSSTETRDDFNKIIIDFTKDLETTFPELNEQFKTIDFDEYNTFCMNEYPKRFFDILYENNDIFKEDCHLLPNLNFSILMNDESVSNGTKKTIWKYLQLVLFCVCNDSDEMENFGDANLLFQAINENDLQQKISETMNEMKEIFMDASNENFENMFNDISNGGMFDASQADASFSSFLDADKMNDHLSGLMNGKIGSMAKEIAEEATKEFSGENGEFNQEEMMKQVLKNPGKIMNLVKNIGGKLDEKLKSGEYNESELMEEAQELMGKMKDMPGVKQMMQSMGLGGGKMDFKGMASKMQQSMKEAKMKEAMRAKMERRAKERQEAEKMKAAQVNANLQQTGADSFVWTDENSNPSTPLKRSSKQSSSKAKALNKKKKAGKKKK